MMALTQVQQALYSKLSGDGVLMGMISGVFDTVPERTVLPYVVIGDGAMRSEDTPADSTARCALTLHVWTDAQGRKAALTIMERLYGLLHQGTLGISGFECIEVRCEDAETRLEASGEAMHGEMNFSVLVRATS